MSRVVFVTALLAACGWRAAPTIGTWLVCSRPLDAPEVIVSLASHEWERLPAAAALARRYPGSRVVLTLPEQVTPYNCHDCLRRTARLARAGVRPDRVDIAPLRAPGTYGEALAVRDLLRGRRIHRLVVVTSPYHTRRALATFRRVMGDTPIRIGVVPAPDLESPPHPDAWWRWPADRAYIGYEWAAILFYGVRYGVWGLA